MSDAIASEAVSKPMQSGGQSVLLPRPSDDGARRELGTVPDSFEPLQSPASNG
jgi:hypothetical protein